MRTSFVAIIALAIASSANASNMFNEVLDSNRVERIMYTDSKVVRIGGIVNQPFFIEFKSDEPLDDVAGGSISGWEVHKKNFRLFLRALPNAKQATLLVTSRSRSYVFDLVPMKSTPGNYENRRSKIVFYYLPPPAPAVVASAPPEPPLPAPLIYRNDNYSMQVVSLESDIKPRDVYDDGRFTWFKFPKNLEIPAIYRSTPNTKDEILVNSHRDGDYMVMHAISPLWNLRLAGSMVGVFNDSYDAEGVAPINGATVHGLTRDNKNAAK